MVHEAIVSMGEEMQTYLSMFNIDIVQSTVSKPSDSFKSYDKKYFKWTLI